MARVGILGAGAVGSMIGGLIAHQDPSVEVVMLARGEHGNWMREHGHVVLSGSWGERQAKVRVCDGPDDLTDCDLLILTVKSQDTDQTISDIAPYIGKAILVSLQNGLNQRTLVNHLPEEQFLVGMTTTNSAMLKPGHISLQRSGITLIGSSNSDPAMDRITAALNLLRKSGLPMHSHENIVGVQLNKVSINCVGYTSVLSETNFLRDGVLHKHWRREVALPLLDECFAVLTATGIPFARVPGPSDIRRFRRLLTMLDMPVLGSVVAGGIWSASRTPLVYSVEQDLRRGRATEIDFVNGEIVRQAQEHGANAPLNAKVVELFHELEQRQPLEFFSRDEVIDRIRSVRTATP